MGSVHKFQRPPKNEQQFKGPRPGVPTGTGARRRAPRRLSDRQKSVLAWAAVIALAGALWAVGRLF